MKFMKTLIFSFLFLISFLGFGQTSSKVISNNNTQNYDMVMEFVKFKTEFEKQIEKNHESIKKGTPSKSDIEKINAQNISFKKILEDKISEITLKYNVSKNELYSSLSEYYKKEKTNNIKNK